MATYRERNQGKAKLFIASEDRKRLAKKAKENQPQTKPEDSCVEFEDAGTEFLPLGENAMQMVTKEQARKVQLEEALGQELYQEACESLLIVMLQHHPSALDEFEDAFPDTIEQLKKDAGTE
jgi:hypothetical protein